jgi:hypothetical protein
VALRGRFGAEIFQETIESQSNVRLLSVEENAGMVAVTGEKKAAAEVLSTILRAGLEIADITMQEPSLQSVFIKLTGRELRD